MPRSNIAVTTELSFFGKLPLTGDYIARNIAAGQMTLWERWLDDALTGSKKVLGALWPVCFNASPTWRFYLPPEVTENTALVGMFAPSQDSVGRLYPFILYFSVPASARACLMHQGYSSLFAGLEKLVQAAKHLQYPTLQTFIDACNSEFTAQLVHLPTPYETPVQAGSGKGYSYPPGWTAVEAITAFAIQSMPASLAVFWCEGSARHRGVFRQLQGLPQAPDLTAMLDGAWMDIPRSTYEPVDPAVMEVPELLDLPELLEVPELMDLPELLEVPDLLEVPGLLEGPDLVEMPEAAQAAADPAGVTEPFALPAMALDSLDLLPDPLFFHDPLLALAGHLDETLLLGGNTDNIDTDPVENHAASVNRSVCFFSETGGYRKNNEDCIMVSPQLGLYAVADGMGGHENGEYASRQICLALENLPLAGNLESRLLATLNCLSTVNYRINEYANDKGIVCGSTVVALIMDGLEASIIWAGDSRLYHWQHTSLRQITRDHDGTEHLSEQERRLAIRRSNMISRAIGAQPEVELDVLKISLQPGDRLLLCTDGVHGVLLEQDIERALGQRHLEDACQHLKQAALDNGTRDNLSGILIELPAADMLLLPDSW